MSVTKLPSKIIPISKAEALFSDVHEDKSTGGNYMGNHSDEEYVKRHELQAAEQRLAAKIEISEVKLSGKIDTSTTKIDSQSKLLYWIMGIISAGIIVPLIAAVIKILFSK